MTEANTPVPQESLHPYDAGYRAIKVDPPTTTVLRCDECRETLTVSPERDQEQSETRFLADHAYRHADPDRNNGAVDFTITHSQQFRSGETAFPHRRPMPRPNAARPTK